MSSKKIVVSGAAGHLGSTLAPALAKLGYAVTGFDVAAPASPPEGWSFVQADMTREDEMRALLAEADLLVHVASIHPWKKYSHAQYIDINVKGTYLLYALMAELGLRKVVLTSSIAANAMGGVPMSDWPVTEEAQYTPRDIYSYTKFCQEEAARSFALSHQIQTIALRPPAFMPADELTTCFRLTGCFGVVADIAAAHVAAVEVMMGDRPAPEPLGLFEAFYITCDHPYTAADVPLLCGKADPMPMVRKYWPQHVEWLESKGYGGAWLPAIYDNSKAKRLLGWQPRFNFVEAIAALRSPAGAPAS